MLLCGSFIAYGQSEKPQSAVGVIRGTVVNETGKPVPGAKVWADKLEGGLVHGIARYAAADGDGRFALEHLDLVQYKIFAKNEEEGYPDTGFAFYSPEPPVKIALSASTKEAAVLVVIGPKAATIKGSTSDARTGAPVLPVISMRHAGANSRGIASSLPAQYSVLVPAGASILFEVSAAGYRTWYYPGNGAVQATPLTLKSGEQMTLDIQMEPEY
jgi:hypothetical protein